MCDSKAEGGRRCPCNKPEVRAATRRARAAAHASPEGGVGGAGSGHIALPLGIDLPLLDRWDADEARALTREVSAATSARVIFDGDGGFLDPDSEEASYLTGEEKAGQRAHIALSGRYTNPHLALMYVGQSLALEAERRAGVTGEQVAARAAEQDRADLEAVAEAEKALTHAEAERDAHPAYQQVRALEAECTSFGARLGLRKDPKHKQVFADLTESGVIERYQEARDRLTQARMSAATGGDQGNGSDPDLSALAGAYREVLAEVRPFGGATAEWGEDSDRGLVSDMGDVTEMFPRSWTERHNDVERVTLTLLMDGRAHYRPARRDWLSGEVQESATLATSYRLKGGLVSPEKVGGTYGASLHEMSHRYEDVVPEITLMEDAFYQRRTTDPESGAPEDLVPLMQVTTADASPGELVRPDSFVTAYMGKDYGPRTKFREVLSVGMESLFGGTHGGLVGAGRYDPDPDTRAFILGVLATAGRHEEKGVR